MDRETTKGTETSTEDGIITSQRAKSNDGRMIKVTIVPQPLDTPMNLKSSRTKPFPKCDQVELPRRWGWKASH